MKQSYKVGIYFLIAIFFITGCKDILDRPEKTKVVDSEFWRNESDLRLAATNFYPNYFVGYSSAWGTAYAPLRGYNFADDFTSEGRQGSFETTAPNTRGSTSSETAMLATYSGPNWNFYWVRAANLMLERIETESKPNLSEEEYNHWVSVARFFKGFEYSRLVSVFGDVPYYDSTIEANDTDEQYKERTDRGTVMDAVYEDFEFVLNNMRLDDGAQQVNRYVAASIISRLMLFEGSWLFYHDLDKERAEKYLKQAMDAAELVMDSGKWNFGGDFKSLFASEDLAGHPEVIFHRIYSEGVRITHHIGSYSNGTEGQAQGPNLDLIKAFVCNDGQAWQNSSVSNADDFSVKSLAQSRDPRFEATFMDTVNTASSTLLYGYKFAAREALEFIGSTYPAKWASNTNTNDAPIIRLAEVVLNWVEAKQILAEGFGGSAVTQGDIDKSINAIRDRPLDDVALSKGVNKTEPLQLSNILSDPSRDADVSPLLWEIRRERRMEFVFEHTRLNDLRRWKKLHYMDFSQDPDYSMGPWINFKEELPSRLSSAYVGVLKVMKQNGNVITYDGNNDNDMVGFYVVPRFENRASFNVREYLAPVGIALIQEYADLGYTLKQTDGWE